MRTRKVGLFMAACLSILVWASPAAAQETRGAVDGIVKDATGGVLPGVTVTAKQAGTGVSSIAITDSVGRFRFPSLAPGSYNVTANLGGFAPQTFDNVTVKVGEQLQLNVTLSLAGLAVSETVRAESPIIDVKQNAVQKTVTADLIALMPNTNRDFLSVLTGIAGTNYESDISGSRATGLMIDGASQSENRFIIDGQDTTNLRNGLSGKGLVVDFIEQLQVKQSGYNAEYRATTGGVVSAITKSGTNSFHAGVGVDYKGKLMNGLLGDIRPTLQLCPTCSGNNPPAEYFTSPRTSEYEQQTVEPIAEISGPIIQNKAWFFLGYNNAIFNQDRTIQWANPVVSGVTYPSIQTFNGKSTDFRYVYNGTLQVRPDLRIRVSANNQRGTSALGLPAVTASTFVVDAEGRTIGTSLSNAATFNPRSKIYTASRSDSYSVTGDWNVNEKTYANITGGYLFTGTGSQGGDYYHGVRRVFSGSNINYLDVPASLQGPTGFADNLSNSFTIFDRYVRYNIQGDITRFTNWRGQHAFKVGFQYERIGNDSDTGQQDQNVTLFWNASRNTLDNRFVRGTYGYYSVIKSFTEGSIRSNNIGAFLQDQWSFNQKLTINYGVRFDRTSIPSYRPENRGITFGFGDKVAPRLGFAYDVKGDGKWKAFGSWGIFYDIEKLEMPRGAWGAERAVTYYWTLDNYNWPAINCTGLPNSGCPGTYIEQNDIRHVSNDPKNDLVDPNMNPFKAQELVVGLDHELNRLMSVGGRYVHKWVGDTIEDVGTQVVGIGEVYYIGNPGFGLGAYPLGTPFPRNPAPQRDYDAVELTFQRRLANNWSVNANVTFSRLYGNYSGLSNSTSESNRNSPNVSRLWDQIFMGFTQDGCPDRVNCRTNTGLISTSRPVQFKLQATYILPWGTSAGVDYQAFNGNLQTTFLTYKAVPVMIYGPGDLGRTGMYSNTNLNFSQTFRMPRGIRATFQLVILNLFDQDFGTSQFTTRWRDGLTLAGDSCTLCGDPFFNGFDAAALQAARFAANNATGRPDPRYGMENAFRGARSARFYMKFSF